MSKAEVDNLVEEARKYAEEDEKNRHRVEVRNTLENYAYMAGRAAHTCPLCSLSSSTYNRVFLFQLN